MEGTVGKGWGRIGVDQESCNKEILLCRCKKNQRVVKSIM